MYEIVLYLNSMTGRSECIECCKCQIICSEQLQQPLVQPTQQPSHQFQTVQTLLHLLHLLQVKSALQLIYLIIGNQRIIFLSVDALKQNTLFDRTQPESKLQLQHQQPFTHSSATLNQRKTCRITADPCTIRDEQKRSWTTGCQICMDLAWTFHERSAKQRRLRFIRKTLSMGDINCKRT